MDYNARFYSPVLGRFISPDTIVPDPTSSGGFNRYRYTRNNPLKYVDPSGHRGCSADDQSCWDNQWYRARGYEKAGGEWTYTGNFHIEEGDADFYTGRVQDPDKIKREMQNAAEGVWRSLGSVEGMARAVELGAALFVEIIKRYADEHDVDLGFQVKGPAP